MDLRECRRSNLIKEVKVDKNLVQSLVKSARNKQESQEMLVLSQKTAASKISLAYDSLRELLEAIAILNGYKIYNHECYRSFLKEVLKESEFGDRFDKIRKIRNSINYYGKDFETEEAKEILDDIDSLGKHLKNKYMKL